MKLGLRPGLLFAWASACVGSTFGASHVAAEWPMFRHDPARSGWAESPTPELKEIAWSADLGGPVDCSPAVLGGVVYAATSVGAVHALQASTGQPRWRTVVGSPVVSSPCADAERVYFGCTDGYIYALSANSGEPVWKARTDRAVIAPPLFIDRKIVCGSTDGRLYALDAATGNVVWRTDPGGEIHAGAAAAGELVVYGDWERQVRCVRLADGTLVWGKPVRPTGSYRADGPILACPVIAGDAVVVGSLAPTALTPHDSLNIHTLDLATGRRRWGAPGANPWQTDKEHLMSVSTCPTVIGDQIWFLTMEGYGNWSAVLRSTALATGARGFASTALGNREAFVPSDCSAAVANGILHLADYAGMLSQFDTTAGQPLKSLALGARTVSSPAISDGCVYIGLTDGRLLCIR
jgi:outer membrane protein assembly factor BamB